MGRWVGGGGRDCGGRCDSANEERDKVAAWSKIRATMLKCMLIEIQQPWIRAAMVCERGVRPANPKKRVGWGRFRRDDAMRMNIKHTYA